MASFVHDMVRAGPLRPSPTSHAGLHLYARLAAGLSEREVIERCERHDVAVTSLAGSWMRDPSEQALLIAFGRAGGAELDRGLAVVRDALVR